MEPESVPSATQKAVESTPAELPVESVPEVTAEIEQPKDTPTELPAEPTSVVAAETEESKTTPTEVPAETSPETVIEKQQPETPLSKLFGELPKIIVDAEHGEMWGVKLEDATNVPTNIILQKFLRANNDDVAKAKTQLLEALQWRKKVDPLKLLTEVEHNKEKFGNLGYVTAYNSTGTQKEIITWNIYGAVKDIKGTFENVEEFIKWRTALMELSIKELDLASATEKIPDGGPDPYRMIQVHDYLNVSFLRMDPSVRAASKAAIQTFAMAYPELVKEKFFVNVPLAMGWVFAALKLFLSAETIKKFHPLSYGGSLAGEIPECGVQLPEVYGGKGQPLTEGGLVVKYGNVEEPEPESK